MHGLVDLCLVLLLPLSLLGLSPPLTLLPLPLFLPLLLLLLPQLLLSLLPPFLTAAAAARAAATSSASVRLDWVLERRKLGCCFLASADDLSGFLYLLVRDDFGGGGEGGVTE